MRGNNSEADYARVNLFVIRGFREPIAARLATSALTLAPFRFLTRYVCHTLHSRFSSPTIGRTTAMTRKKYARFHSASQNIGPETKRARAVYATPCQVRSGPKLCHPLNNAQPPAPAPSPLTTGGSRIIQQCEIPRDPDRIVA